MVCLLIKDHAIFLRELLFFQTKATLHGTENLKARILKIIITWFAINETKRKQKWKASKTYYNATYGNLHVRNIEQKLY